MMEPTSLVILSIIVFAAAILGGMMGGSFLIILPAMIFFGMGIHEAIGTSKLLMIALGLSSIIYYQKGDIKLKSSLPFILTFIIGIVIGSIIVIQIPEIILKNIIAVLVIIIAFILLNERKLGLKEKKIKKTTARNVLIIVIAFVVGIYSGFYAAADSLLIVMIFVLLAGTTFIEAVGNARIMDIIAGVVGLTMFHKFGVVDYGVGIWLAVACLIGGLVGAEVAIKVGNRWLRRLLFVISIAMAIKLLFFP